VFSAEPMTLHAADEDLEDLRARLRRYRPAEPLAEAGWTLGTDAAYLDELVRYWAEEFDWRAQEAALNAWPHLRATVGGREVHVLHARSAEPGALPLLLCHGWPDSFWRYLPVLPHLLDPVAYGGDPADAFDVVVPDMPGYGWSPAPLDRILDTTDVAHLWAELMTGLGYERFGASGGDIGSGVVRDLALDHPDRLVGAHRMDVGLPAPSVDRSTLTPEEVAWLDQGREWQREEGAYNQLHRTKPQTVAAALNDSPAGLASWIVEKLRSWSDCGGDVSTRFTMDDVLTDVTIYWLTGTIGSSMRMYHANAAVPVSRRTARVEVPSGFSIFPGDIVRAPRVAAEKASNLVHYNALPSGGHFAPFEEPAAYARELREMFRPLR
jgi:pimeloyl-ACP methyl ester carboxylesterase